MKQFTSARSLIAAGVGLGALTLASIAQARSDVYLSIGVQSPHVYAQPAPVYAHPSPVYVTPRPVYVQPQPVYTPAPDYRRYDDGRGYYDRGAERRGAWGDHNRDGIANIHDPDSPRNHRRIARMYGPYGDLDRDGVLNQDDRDRDGDGVRNRHDRFPDDPYRY